MDFPAADRCQPDDPRLSAILALIQNTFAYMENRIDPPSSMKRLTVEAIQHHCEIGEVWALGDPPMACVFLKENNGCLYIGKLAVATNARRQGIAKKLMKMAETRAIHHGFTALELEVRIELTENQMAFQKLGFSIVNETSHEGFDRPTSVTMRKTL